METPDQLTENKISEAISKLRTELGEELESDPEANTFYSLERFWKGADENFELFKTRVHANLKFRRDKYEKAREVNMRDMLRKTEGLMEAGVYNYTKQGNPIYYQRSKKLDMSRLEELANLDNMATGMINTFERRIRIIFPIASEKFQKKITKNVVVMDLDGIPLMKVMNSKFRDLSKFGSTFSSNNYPDILEKMFIINAPYIFKGVYAVVSLWLDEKIKSKISIHSDNASKTLKELIDVELIPRDYGGTCDAKITDQCGPWQEEFWASVDEKRFTMKDRSLERKWYYSEEEYQRIVNLKPNDLYYDLLKKQEIVEPLKDEEEKIEINNEVKEEKKIESQQPETQKVEIENTKEFEQESITNSRITEENN